MSALPRPEPVDTITRSIEALTHLQAEDGCWRGDYSGPLFLPAMFVAARYATGTLDDPELVDGFVTYLHNVQNDDGGFGLGEQNPSTVFTTVLCYVTLRLLGQPADAPACARARAWFLARGGAIGSASWGKFTLCLLNLHDWEGIHPLPPETWLLPYAAPVHPARLWCHARQVYLPMAWLYGARASLPLDDTLRALRDELYTQPYDTIDWAGSRDVIAATDNYAPRSPALRKVDRAMAAFEAVCPRWLRRRALAEVLDHIRYEDDESDSICIGPVNKALNLLVWHFVEPGGERVRKHLVRLDDYVSTDALGTRMNGYNNSRFWDTAFCMQALLATGRPEADLALERAHAYVDAHQVATELPQRDRYYRQPRLGAWPFSDQPHGWPITDCTAEGLTVALAMRGRVEGALGDDRLALAVERILERQNDDGGWGSYEKARGPEWLQRLNPSEIFGEIMIDASFTECTAACIHGLDQWRRRDGATPDPRVDRAIDRARDRLLAMQRPDGGWEGFWGVCFTYGTWFGIRGLRAAGLTADHPAIQRAADFLESIQLADGGWGETIDSCREHRPIPTPSSQPVMTAWAVLGLCEAGRGRAEATRRGVAALRDLQLDDGTWPQQGIAGVFNRTCSINYDSYRKYFPLWALAVAERG
ncbi:MAG TPA: terpene cyclase/mutase family protein [Myxococcota bacterium]|nr:terpene cyclase/mutase family protein [Myxococcota bacterium]